MKTNPVVDLLFFLFLFCLSSFFSIFMYLFIYFVLFIFFFKNILVFKNMFFNRIATSPGPLQRLPWPPCPAPPYLSLETYTHIDTRNGQWLEESSRRCPHRDTTVALIYRIVIHSFVLVAFEAYNLCNILVS
jgi:hypothetical protein